ncbi:MAG TPA: hypothetical protein DCP92_04365 [Nitrospiraceae bacterium]|nr:hypothetical protein [Nitrospiraceae bacterium]
MADSKGTKLARNSSRWVRLTPGSGVSFINGIMKVILDEGLYDRNIASTVDNFSSVENMVKGLALFFADSCRIGISSFLYPALYLFMNKIGIFK